MRNGLNWVRLPCGMHIGTVKTKRASWLQGKWNRIRKTVKRMMEG